MDKVRAMLVDVATATCRLYIVFLSTLAQGRSPSYNPPGVQGCNPLLGCFGSDPAARHGKPTFLKFYIVMQYLCDLLCWPKLTVGRGTNLPEK